MSGRNPPADQQAFAALFERHKNLVYKTAYLMLGDALEAEEALQEVFVLVYKTNFPEIARVIEQPNETVRMRIDAQSGH